MSACCVRWLCLRPCIYSQLYRAYSGLLTGFWVHSFTCRVDCNIYTLRWISYTTNYLVFNYKIHRSMRLHESKFYGADSKSSTVENTYVEFSYYYKIYHGFRCWQGSHPWLVELHGPHLLNKSRLISVGRTTNQHLVGCFALLSSGWYFRPPLPRQPHHSCWWTDPQILARSAWHAYLQHDLYKYFTLRRKMLTLQVYAVCWNAWIIG